MEQSLLLPKDMTDLKSLKQHEVFLRLKRDLGMVIVLTEVCFFVFVFFCFFFFLTPLPFQAIQATFRVEEMVNSSHRRMKKEEGRRIAVVNAFHVAEKSNKDLKAKLAEEENERKFATAALNNTKKQVENQQLLLRITEDQLVASKE